MIGQLEEAVKKAQLKRDRAREKVSKAEEELRKTEVDLLRTKAEKKRIEAPVSIKDIVIVGKHEDPGGKSYGAGEYDSRGISGSWDFPQVKARLTKTIGEFIEHASDIHKSKYCDADDQLLPDKKNSITRLSTNEFLFYTKRPLTFDEFMELMREIAESAANQPENLHLALSSFAVRAPDNFGIINVVPYIQCGPNPQINFAVKNYPSPVDPTYTTTIHLPPKNLEVKKHYPNLGIASSPSSRPYSIPDQTVINIGGRPCPMSYNNTIKCKTAGGAEFYACIDICLDHIERPAQRDFERLEDAAKKSGSLSPVQKWLLITSNWIGVEKSACSRRTTYADRLSEKAEEPSKRFSTCKPELESHLAPTTGIVTTFPLPSLSPNYKIKSYKKDTCAISTVLTAHNNMIIAGKTATRDQVQTNLEEARRSLREARRSLEKAKQDRDNYLRESDKQPTLGAVRRNTFSNSNNRYNPYRRESTTPPTPSELSSKNKGPGNSRRGW